MYYVYIIRSQKDGGYYFGHSSNLELRLQTHNAGKVKSTKNRRPFILYYYETLPSKSFAYQREMFFKSFEGRIWLIQNKIIESVK